MNASLVITVLLVLFGYGTWAYFHPFRPCPRCKGRGTNRGSTRRRTGPCGRCGGSRQVQTRGSRMLHRAIRGAVRSSRDRKGK